MSTMVGVCGGALTGWGFGWWWRQFWSEGGFASESVMGSLLFILKWCRLFLGGGV